LGISLKHHDAASDALACATIALRAMKQGFLIHSATVGSRIIATEGM
jgi:DNA polymerase III epsilon subunit-like protein